MIKSEVKAGINTGEQGRGRCASWTLPEMLREMDTTCEGLVSDLIQVFKVDTAARLGRARRAIAESDMSVFKAEIHAIKGSACQIGAALMASTCREIELAAASTSISNLAEAVSGLDAEFAGVCQAMTSYSPSTEDCHT